MALPVLPRAGVEEYGGNLFCFVRKRKRVRREPDASRVSQKENGLLRRFLFALFLAFGQREGCGALVRLAGHVGLVARAVAIAVGAVAVGLLLRGLLLLELRHRL